jgi:hypothetical protein
MTQFEAKKIQSRGGRKGEREREHCTHRYPYTHHVCFGVLVVVTTGKFSFCCSIAALVILCGVNSKLRAFFLVQGFASSVDQEFSQLLTRSEVSSLESRVRRRRRRKTSRR